MRLPTRVELSIAAALALGGPWLAGCGNACGSLSRMICECKPNEPERAACVELVRLAEAQRDVITAQELAVCESKLDTCTCEALEAGDLAACGLAK